MNNIKRAVEVGNRGLVITHNQREIRLAQKKVQEQLKTCHDLNTQLKMSNQLLFLEILHGNLQGELNKLTSTQVALRVSCVRKTRRIP